MPERRRRPPKSRRRLGALTRGEAIAAAAAILLLAFMFFGWYGAEVSGQAREIKLGGGSGAGGNAWQTLEGLSLVMLLVILVTVGAALLRLFAPRRDPALPSSAVVTVLGGLAALLTLLRILVPPELGSLGGIQINATVELGAYLGLAAACGIAYGGYRAMAEHGTSFAQVANSLSRDRSKQD